MKLFSFVLFGLGMARAGLAAPAAVANQIITTEDGIPLARPRIVRVDVAPADVPALPHALHLLAARLSGCASGALELVRSSARRRHRDLPVFGFGADAAQVMTDGDGNLVTISYGSRVRAIIWNRSTRSFFLYPVSGLRDGLPIAILAICLSVISACLLLRSMATDHEFAESLDLDLAEKALALSEGPASKHRLEKSSALAG